jgi:putative membrane protein
MYCTEAGHMMGVTPFGWLFQLAILVIFFLIIYWIFKGSKTSDNAMEILKKRHAKGEISRKEFEKLKKDIK